MDDYEKITLFNAKLYYVNKLFITKNFSDIEKKLIIERIDREETISRVKWVCFRLLGRGSVRFLDPIKPIKGIEKHKM
jgi:hypothetical protein